MGAAASSEAAADVQHRHKVRPDRLHACSIVDSCAGVGSCILVYEDRGLCRIPITPLRVSHPLGWEICHVGRIKPPDCGLSAAPRPPSAKTWRGKTVQCPCGFGCLPWLAALRPTPVSLAHLNGRKGKLHDVPAALLQGF